MFASRALSVLPLLAALASTAVFAEAHFTVRTDLPATVLMDGRTVGKTPLDLKMAYPGEGKIEVLNKATGLSYTYKVRSPEVGTASRIIDSSFQGAAPISGPIINQVTLSAPPEPLAKPVNNTDRREREKVRIRNTVLGGGLINALFNHGIHRHGVFVGLFWLGLLNELLHSR